MQQSTTKENWNKIIQFKNWFWVFCLSYSVILLCDFVEKLFTYFQRKEIPKEESLTAACDSWKENPSECIIVEEFENVQKNRQVDKLQNKKHVFGEKEKQEIAKFTLEQFLNLTESTIWPGDKTYNENLKEKKKPNNEVALKIGQTGGMSLLLDVGLHSKTQAMIISLTMAGAGISQHVVREVLIGLVKPYPEKFGKYDISINKWNSHAGQLPPQNQLLLVPCRMKSRLSSFTKFHKKYYCTAFLMSWSKMQTRLLQNYLWLIT